MQYGIAVRATRSIHSYVVLLIRLMVKHLSMSLLVKVRTFSFVFSSSNIVSLCSVAMTSLYAYLSVNQFGVNRFILFDSNNISPWKPEGYPTPPETWLFLFESNKPTAFAVDISLLKSLLSTIYKKIVGFVFPTISFPLERELFNNRIKKLIKLMSFNFLLQPITTF